MHLLPPRSKPIIPGNTKARVRNIKYFFRPPPFSGPRSGRKKPPAGLFPGILSPPVRTFRLPSVKPEMAGAAPQATREK